MAYERVEGSAISAAMSVKGRNMALDDFSQGLEAELQQAHALRDANVTNSNI